MKSIIITSLLMTTLCTSFTQAQFIKAYGFKTGAVIASQSIDYTIFNDFRFVLPTENRWGFDAGGFIELFGLPYVSLLTELHYSQKGYSSTLQETTPAQPAGTGRFFTYKARVDYLSMPIL